MRLPCRLYSHQCAQRCCGRCGCEYHAGYIHTTVCRGVVAGVGVISMQVMFTPLCAGVLL